MFDSIHSLPGDLQSMGWESTGVVVTPHGNRSELDGPIARSKVSHHCLLDGCREDVDEGRDPLKPLKVAPDAAAGIEVYAAMRVRRAVRHVLRLVFNAHGDSSVSIDYALHMLEIGCFDFLATDPVDEAVDAAVAFVKEGRSPAQRDGEPNEAHERGQQEAFKAVVAMLLPEAECSCHEDYTGRGKHEPNACHMDVRDIIERVESLGGLETSLPPDPVRARYEELHGDRLRALRASIRKGGL